QQLASLRGAEPAERIAVQVSIDKLRGRMALAGDGPDTLLAKMTNRLASAEQKRLLAEHDELARLAQTKARVKLLVSYIERSIAIVSTQRKALETMLVQRAEDQGLTPQQTTSSLLASFSDRELRMVLDAGQLKLVRQLLRSSPTKF
ncbi:MAG TPA: hypothetical protein DDW52_24485, partial [Planctomycetaceae bacterium]|nr:hypothetical protein [Planctomycetaceae bacterium]